MEFWQAIAFTEPDQLVDFARSAEELGFDGVAAGDHFITPERIDRARKCISEIYVDDNVKEYILDIVFATRTPGEVSGLGKDFGRFVEYGASPRASIWLARAARAHAFMRRRGYVIPEDIKAIAPDILRHRVIPTYEAEAEETTSDDLVNRILEVVEVP